MMATKKATAASRSLYLQHQLTRQRFASYTNTKKYTNDLSNNQPIVPPYGPTDSSGINVLPYHDSSPQHTTLQSDHPLWLSLTPIMTTMSNYDIPISIAVIIIACIVVYLKRNTNTRSDTALKTPKPLDGVISQLPSTNKKPLPSNNDHINKVSHNPHFTQSNNMNRYIRRFINKSRRKLSEFKQSPKQLQSPSSYTLQTIGGSLKEMVNVVLYLCFIVLISFAIYMVYQSYRVACNNRTFGHSIDQYAARLSVPPYCYNGAVDVNALTPMQSFLYRYGIRNYAKECRNNLVAQYSDLSSMSCVLEMLSIITHDISSIITSLPFFTVIQLIIYSLLFVIGWILIQCIQQCLSRCGYDPYYYKKQQALDNDKLMHYSQDNTPQKSFTSKTNQGPSHNPYTKHKRSNIKGKPKSSSAKARLKSTQKSESDPQTDKTK